MTSIAIEIQDANGYEINLTMGLMESIGDLKEHLRKRTNKVFSSDELTFNGDAISGDDEMKIVMMMTTPLYRTECPWYANSPRLTSAASKSVRIVKKSKPLLAPGGCCAST